MYNEISLILILKLNKVATSFQVTIKSKSPNILVNKLKNLLQPSFTTKMNRTFFKHDCKCEKVSL